MFNFKKIGVLGLATFAFAGSVNALTAANICEKGSIDLKSVPLTTTQYKYAFQSINESQFIMTDGSVSIDAEDSNKAHIYKQGQEQCVVDINYVYDKDVKTVVDNLITSLGTTERVYHLNDMETLAYYYSVYEYNKIHENDENQDYVVLYTPNSASFSSDYRKDLQYKNFELRIGAGGQFEFDAPLVPINKHNRGDIVFIYDGTFYGKAGIAKVYNRQLFFIPEDTEDVAKYIKDKVNDLYEVTSVTKAQYKNADLTIETYADELKSAIGSYWDINKSTEYIPETYRSDEEDAEKKANYIQFIVDAIISDEINGSPYLELANNNDYIYKITFKNGFEYYVIPLRKTEKANEKTTIVTSDTGTGVEISTEGIIPLDTLIQVAKITSGDEYNRIVKVLNSNNVEMFDLKLFSQSLDTNITKLDNGKFKVKLPIKEEFKGKDFKIYYVDEDGKKEEFKYTLSDDGNYAIFETDHFSIYTIAITTNNPKTGDNLVLYLLVLTASGYALYKARKFN